jgi:RNA polymerase sigma-70 factor, ECF subfamily
MTSPSDRPSTGPGAVAPNAPPDDRQALDLLFSVAYEELRRLASSVRRDEASSTLSPTALVNEAWLKLARSPRLGDTSPAHFKRIAARAMRQVLIEAARKRRTEKRGGGELLVTLDEALDEALDATSLTAPRTADDLIALDEALDALAQISPRQALMVESRYFGGLEMHEIASLLGVSEATVMRDWRAARAWLARALRQSS